MKRLLLFVPLLLLAGCFGPPKPYLVTGASGKAYTAPDLCVALVACKNANEDACYYPAVKMTSVDGKTVDESYCKQVGK